MSHTTAKPKDGRASGAAQHPVTPERVATMKRAAFDLEFIAFACEHLALECTNTEQLRLGMSALRMAMGCFDGCLFHHQPNPPQSLTETFLELSLQDPLTESGCAKCGRTTHWFEFQETGCTAPACPLRTAVLNGSHVYPTGPTGCPSPCRGCGRAGNPDWVSKEHNYFCPECAHAGLHLLS